MNGEQTFLMMDNYMQEHLPNTRNMILDTLLSKNKYTDEEIRLAVVYDMFGFIPKQDMNLRGKSQ